MSHLFRETLFMPTLSSYLYIVKIEDVRIKSIRFIEWTLAILPVVVNKGIKRPEIALGSFRFISDFVNTQFSFKGENIF